MAVRETAYDTVFDSVRHFRTILDGMARPGTIGGLDPVALDPPAGLSVAGACVALALLSGDVSFHAARMDDGESAYLSANTLARSADVGEADFVFLSGRASRSVIDAARQGNPLYPETGPTAVIDVGLVSRTPIEGGLRITVEGPGVDGRAVFFAAKLGSELLEALKDRNAEFPLGVDAILTGVNGEGAPAVACLPRTAKATWECC